jgi:hypothetical protein
MTMTIRTSARRRAQATAIALGVGASLAAVAAPAQALTVTSGTDGLVMNEPRNTLDRVSVAIVDGGARYRVEMPRFGGLGLDAAAGCVKEPPQADQPDVVTCDRVVARVDANFGPLGDSFTVDPSFPDPIHVFGDLGDDTIRLGAAADVALGGSGRDRISGFGGDDELDGGADDDALFGGDGNDRLHATGGGDVLDGEAGDDALSADPAPQSNTAATLIGGPGTDSFAGNGSTVTIDARDGVKESVSCGKTRKGFLAVDRVFAQAIVDLVDDPDDGGLVAGGCTRVDRAPRGERMSARLRSTSLRVTRGRVALRVRCATRATCKGRASVKVDRGRSSAVRYAVRGKDTATVKLRLASSSARRVTRRGAIATVQLDERGTLGGRTAQTRLRITR